MAHRAALVSLGPLLLGGIAFGEQRNDSTPSVARPDIDITIYNNCPFGVDVAWFETTGCRTLVNMLLLKQSLPSKGSARRVATKAPYVGSRIYAWAVDGQVMPPQTPSPLPEDLFAGYVARSPKARCGDPYAQHRFGGLPQSFASFAELTFTDDGTHVFNDADISNVAGFYLPMGWDFDGTSPWDPACHNSSLATFPKEPDCRSAGGKWLNLGPTWTPSPGAPTGWCQAPQDLCPSSEAICSAFAAELAGLTRQLDFSYAALQAHKAFTWISRAPAFAGQLWTCNAFLNAPEFAMAEMCAAINRGACDFARLGALGPDDFKHWVDTECGPTQNADPSSWWKHPVRNPYAFWLRSTLRGSTYAFSQDEGVHGGNSNCNNNGGPAGLPRASVVTVCPEPPVAAPGSAARLPRSIMV